MFSRRCQLLKRFFCRFKSEDSHVVKSLQFFKYGEPAKVLNICEDQLNATKPNQVLVKILAAPIHPVDIEFVLGERAEETTKEEQQFPLIPGIECVAEVCELGNDVKELEIGQRVVVPYAKGRGTWSTHAIYNMNELSPIPNDIPLEAAALLTVNPCAAYRILKDFIDLQPGECVLLNGSNSALGQAVHQLCKIWNIISVGVLRSRENIKEVKKFVKSLGAIEVLTYKELMETNIFEEGKIPKPRLSLSCVSRSSSKELGRFLDRNGVMVTYGCMAGQPVATATTAFVFKDFVQRPFWMTRWNHHNPHIEQRKEMLDDLCCLIQDNKFQVPETELVPFEKYLDALKSLEDFKGFTAKKFILNMQCEK